MRFRVLLYLSIFSVIVASCSRDESSSLPQQPEIFLFEDGFETENQMLDELFPTDGSRWTNFQQTNPSSNINEVSILNTPVREGENSIRFFSYASDTQLSKIDIEKNGLQIAAGDRLRIEADFFIVGTGSIENLLILDVECCSCWDPTVGDNLGAENQCPGVRLLMSGTNDYLSIERGKIGGPTLQQTNFSFPRNQWVNVVWEMTLSDEDDGVNQLTIDGVEVINTTGMNLPNAEVFREIFAEQDIEFTLQQPVFYERVQIGATANPTADNVELYVDDVSIQIEKVDP
ncbi:MAG: hypothetical protein AAGL34_17630 [Bacteroidota bacterium]